MNLVLSGPIDDALCSGVVAASAPRHVVALHAAALRLEDIVETPTLRASVAALCDVARVDHAFVGAQPGFDRIHMVVMDMDSTLITIECIDEIADYVGRKADVAAITEAAMRGEITDFAESLRRRVALLAGADADVLRRVYDERLKLTDGATSLIAAASAAGAYTLLVSGGFTYFTDRLVKTLPLDAGHANRLEIVDGRLTGRVLEPILGSAEKAQVVRMTMQERSIDPSTVLVIGDGSNDIPMMRLVDDSIAYHAKPAVVQAARHAVRYGSLATVVDYFG